MSTNLQPVILNWPDSCTAEIQPNGEWDFVQANGQHVRGTAADVNAARAAVSKQRDLWILTRWDFGEPIARQRYVVPLT